MQIHRIELPSITGMKTVNSFLIKGEGLTLVDAGEGTEESYQVLKGELLTLGVKLGDLDELLITHAHVDHIGGAGRIAEENNLKVRVSDRVLPWTKGIREQWGGRGSIIKDTLSAIMPDALFQMSEAMYGEMQETMMNIWHDIPQELIETFDILQPEIEINGEKWKMIYAPGHSSTQNCFYHADSRQLLSADMILKITPTPVMESRLDDPTKRAKGILEMLDSYKLFDEMKLDKVFPGHYNVIPNAHEIISDQIVRIHRRKEETFQSIKSGKSKIVEIYNEVYKGKIHLPAFNMLIGYFDLLEDEGRIEYFYNGEYNEIRMVD
ncbi:MAG: glyoxylase-like metal-dependent hydrolase (beta-lactamase superfamily II) [Saprospiraceae bacterium]|jgi:glyoxylase-like metal-dependent hydrolase (beta-lactamase superfamily II)